MSIYERQKEKQDQERAFRVRENRFQALKDKCSFCGSFGSVDEPIHSFVGEDDIIYHYCVDHEYEVIGMSQLPFHRDSIPVGKNFGI